MVKKVGDLFLYACIYVWFKKELLIDSLIKKLTKVVKKNG